MNIAWSLLFRYSRSAPFAQRSTTQDNMELEEDGNAHGSEKFPRDRIRGFIWKYQSISGWQ